MSYPPYNPNEQRMYPPPEHMTTPLSYPVYPGSAAPPSGPYHSGSMPMPSPSPYPTPYPPMSGPQAPYPSQPQPYGYGQPAPYPSYPSHPSMPNPLQNNSAPYPNQPSAMYGNMMGGQVPPNSHHQQPHPNVPFSYTNPKPMEQALKGRPTILPVSSFNSRGDAEVLRKAMKGFGTDEKAIINVLCNRTNAQRQEIAVQFKTLYGKDLIKDLKSEISGNFEDLIVKMMVPTGHFLVQEIQDAINGIGTDEETLIEIICTATNHEIHVIRNEYLRLVGKSLEDDLASETSGSFRRLLISLCQGNRSEDYCVDHAAAQNDAKELLQAGELRFGTDESTFNAILCSRAYPQLKEIFNAYQSITGHDFVQVVENEFSGDIKDGLVAIVKSVRNKHEYFAERLYKSMKGFGTKDRTLQRICILRSEIDMVDVKEAFSHKYGQALEEFIKDDCSGDYKKALIALVT